jgi:hypothetical protein
LPSAQYKVGEDLNQPAEVRRRETVNDRKKNFYNYFVFTDMKELGIDRRPILKSIFKKKDGRLDTNGWLL